MQSFMVQVPPGVAPGQMFHANIGGRLVAVTCPMGIGPGSTLQIQVPMQVPAQPQMYGQPPPRAPQNYPAPQQRQQQPPPQQPLQRQQTVSMNDEMEMKRKAEQAAKEAKEAAVERAKEAKEAAAELKRRPLEEQKAAAADAQHARLQQARHGHNDPLGGASARPGEVSALWWMGMGL